MTVLRIAFIATMWIISGCSAAGASDRPSLTPASQQPIRIPASITPVSPSLNALPSSITDPVVAEIARLAGVPVSEVAIVSAQAMTFSDGSLGCPQPGMAYIQVVTDGYKIVAEAGGKTYDFRGTGSSFHLCSPTVKPAPSTK